jgi:DNA-3-methyladenine glycosylase I
LNKKEMSEIVRCGWSEKYPIMNEYHDNEWGVPLYNENRVFEMFSLDCFQAGLSWITILNKRKAFLEAFDNFDIDKVAGYDAKKIEELLNNPGIVRNRLKIPAVIQNAKIAIDVRKEFGSFSNYIWSFSNGKTIQNRWQKLSDIPAKSAVSDAMSKDMIKRGFRFAGSTILYAFMQSIGMVNDHVVHCFRHSELSVPVRS